MVASRRQAFSAISPLPNPHDRALILRHYVQSSPHLFDRSSMAKQNLSHGDNVVSDGSPSRIRMVRRISLGITTLPRSSILLTIPVAFMYFFLLLFQYFFSAIVCNFRKIMRQSANAYCFCAARRHLKTDAEIERIAGIIKNITGRKNKHRGGLSLRRCYTFLQAENCGKSHGFLAKKLTFH